MMPQPLVSQTEVSVSQCPDQGVSEMAICQTYSWKNLFAYEKFELGTELEDFKFLSAMLGMDIGQLKADSFFELICWNISQSRLLLYPEMSSSKYYEATLQFKLRPYKGSIDAIHLDTINEEDREAAKNMQEFHGVDYHGFFRYLHDYHVPARKKGAEYSFDFDFWVCRITHNIDNEIRKGMTFYQISWLPSRSLAIFYPMSKADSVIVKRIAYSIRNVNELEDME